jgi:hypothetical protein
MLNRDNNHIFFNALKSWNPDVFLKFCIWITILFIVFADYERYEIKKIQEYIKLSGYNYIYMPHLPMRKCTFSREGVKFVAFKDGELVHGVACENFIKLKDKYDG